MLGINSAQSFQSNLGSIMHHQGLKTRFYDKNVFYLRENAIFLAILTLSIYIFDDENAIFFLHFRNQ